MNNKIVHDALVLFAFTVVLGLLLGVVYGITKEPIDKVNYEKTQAAYQQVFADAASFEAYADFDAEAAQAVVTENGYADEIEDVQVAKDASGNAIGYVLTVTAKDASQSTITFSVGIQNEIESISGSTITSRAMANGVNACLVYFRNVLAGGTN